MVEDIANGDAQVYFAWPPQRIIEDAYGGSSPHPLQTVRLTSKFCPKFIEILLFFNGFGGSEGLWGRPCQKGRKSALQEHCG